MIFRSNQGRWRELAGWRPYFILAVIGFLLYSQTLWFNFTYLDDNALILDHAPILANIDNFGRLFMTDVFMTTPQYYYRPLLNVSFMLDAQLGGIVPWIYHLDNIIIHILAALLVFYLLDKLLRHRLVAFFLAAIFLVHPVLVQAVAWVPGRNDSLLAVFVLAAFAVFLRFLEKPRLLSYLGYLFLFFLALLTKESAVALPLMVIYYAYFVDRGRLAPSDRGLLIGGSVAVGFVWFLLRRLAINNPLPAYSIIFGDLWHNAAAILVDLGKIIWPVNLSVLPILENSTISYGLIMIGLLVVFYRLFRFRAQSTYIVFGWLWFLFFLVPSFITIDKVPDFLEHRLYLPFFGFLLALGAAGAWTDESFRRRRGLVIGGAVLIILMSLAFYHSQVFRDRLTFWRSAVSTSPEYPLAQRNLGVMYYFTGNFPEAISHDQKAIALNPQEPMVHNNLGVIYMEQKQYSRAEEEFKKELAVNPDYDKALFNLGDLYEREGNYRAAAQYFQAALTVNPNYGEAYDRLLILQNKLR